MIGFASRLGFLGLEGGVIGFFFLGILEMLGTTLQIARGHGEDRFYNPVKALQSYYQHQHDLSRSPSCASTAYSSFLSLVSTGKSEVSSRLTPEDRTGSEEVLSNSEVYSSSPGASVCTSLESKTVRSCNLDRFLEWTTPSVPVQYIAKRMMRGWSICDVEYAPYFTLGELWDSFKEWSAYGAGVPLVLNGSDCVVQYYVPFLSGIQLYDHHQPCGRAASSRCNGLSSDNGEVWNPKSTLLFEYLEQDSPYTREPLANKVSDLFVNFPALKSLRSCDLSPSSWFSVAWYPIYRIPTGPTLKDLDACFLTFHSLGTPMRDVGNTSPDGGGIPKITLPVFGFASYKMKDSMWTSSMESNSQRISSLHQAAGNWLQLLSVHLPDYQFFSSHASFH